MASKTPVTRSAAKVEAPAIASAKADPVAAKPAARIAKVAAKPPLSQAQPSDSPAPAAKPVAKKKAVVKAAAPEAEKSVAAKIVETVTPVAAPPVVADQAVATKEEHIMEATMQNAAEKAKTMFADANAKSTKAFEDMNEFSKGNIEAIVESGKIAAKGIESMGQDAAEFSRKHLEGATAAMKSMSSVKSPTDFFKLQSDYMRSAFDSMVAQTSKNTEAMLKLAGEVSQPISNRVAVAVEKVKIAA